MGKMNEYITAACGYDANNRPASSSQFTFGLLPLTIAETENVEDLTDITAVCQTDAVVDLKVIDDIALLTFDLSIEQNTLVELFEEMNMYKEQHDHVLATLNELSTRLEVAVASENQEEIEDINMKMRSIKTPFMYPTIVPVEYGGTVHVGFSDDPKFVFFSADKLNETLYKLVLVYDAHDLFCEDEIMRYDDYEADMASEYEELWYMQEMKKAEEELYQSQFGYNNLYDDYDEQPEENKRLKGVRIKSRP